MICSFLFGEFSLRSGKVAWVTHCYLSRYGLIWEPAIARFSVTLLPDQRRSSANCRVRPLVASVCKRHQSMQRFWIWKLFGLTASKRLAVNSVQGTRGWALLVHRTPFLQSDSCLQVSILLDFFCWVLMFYGCEFQICLTFRMIPTYCLDLDSFSPHTSPRQKVMLGK